MTRLLPSPRQVTPVSPGLARKRLATAFRMIREEGPGRLAGTLLTRWAGPVLSRFRRASIEREIEASLATLPPGRPIVIYSTVDFAFPFAQRPQHLARAFAAQGRACFYITPRSGYDRQGPLHRPAENLLVTDEDGLLARHLREPVILVLSTDNRIDPEALAVLRGWSPHLVYDYIDHIDPAISMGSIPQGRLDAHRALLDDPAVTVVASAQVLFDEVAALRRDRLLLVTNGVDLHHYAVPRSRAGLRPDFAAVLDAGRPVVGYFGALASWFDYDLVLALARLRPDLGLVLIGPDYDGSCAAWRTRAGALPANLHLLPPIPYSDLPRHAVWFDVATIPFLVNDITLATSPLKLYEYFAMGAPVVSTPLPECEKHRPAVGIAGTAAEFAAGIDQALALRGSPEHQALLRREAEENSWGMKARAILREVDGGAPG